MGCYVLNRGFARVSSSDRYFAGLGFAALRLGLDKSNTVDSTLIG